jgi:hypothetical protein
MTKHVLAFVVAVCLALSFMPRQAPAPVAPPQPQSRIATVMKPATKEDKARVASFYDSLADVVERDSALIGTVEVFRRVHANSLDAAFKGTDLPGKYSGLDAAINDDLVAAIGLENTGLDVPVVQPDGSSPKKRALLVRALRGVASAAR